METASYNISDIKLFLKNQFRDKTTFLTVFFSSFLISLLQSPRYSKFLFLPRIVDIY